MNRRRVPGWLVCAVLAACSAARAADGPQASAAWARATPPGVSVGAVYLRIDGGTRPDRLLGASSPRAERIEFHRVENADGMMRMRRVAAIELPAGARVELEPQALHLMLIGLSAPLSAGARLPLTLRFETAGEQSIEALVRD